MDRIAIEGIRAYGRHGVLPAEQTLGQLFIVDVALETSLTKAGQSDDLADSVSYVAIYQIVRQEIEEKCYQLIERLCYRIIGRTMACDARIASVEVTVKKPQAPLYGAIDWSLVTMKRKRNELDLSQFRQ